MGLWQQENDEFENIAYKVESGDAHPESLPGLQSDGEWHADRAEDFFWSGLGLLIAAGTAAITSVVLGIFTRFSSAESAAEVRVRGQDPAEEGYPDEREGMGFGLLAVFS